MNNQETKEVTIRHAANFGSRLAFDLAHKLQTERVDAFKWPEKFPITFKRILQLPEIKKNVKVAKRANEAAQAIWQEIRQDAVINASFLLAHPELNDAPQIPEQWSWRELFMEMEQAAGSIFLTDHVDEEIAKKHVYKMLKPTNLKKFITEFNADYKNFIDEIREYIRAKKTIAASTRLELICMLNTNTQKAYKILRRKNK